MFRKLVSNLSFSPALVGQLGFYARRLHREETSRKLGLIFTALALLVQSFVILSPPESANAANPNDLVSGGITSQAEFLQLYDSNSHNLKDILTASGLTRSELTATTESDFSYKGTYIYSRLPQASAAEGEHSLGYITAAQTSGSFYGRPAKLIESGDSSGWVGQSETAGWFAISKQNGNLVTKQPLPATTDSSFAGLGTCPYQPELRASDSNCQPCPTNQSLWVKNVDCQDQVIFTKSAENLTQAADASLSLVKANEKVQYHIDMKNIGTTTASVPISDYLGDVLEYAHLVDTGGGSFDVDSQTISWEPVQLEPGQSRRQSFLVQLPSSIAATARGTSNQISYDCVMSNTIGNTVRLQVDCPMAKSIESAVTQLPPTSQITNLVFGGVLLTVVSYFYARTRQLKKEIRLIRRDLNAGTI